MFICFGTQFERLIRIRVTHIDAKWNHSMNKDYLKWIQMENKLRSGQILHKQQFSKEI